VSFAQNRKELGLPDDNPSTFDDVSIIVADLSR